MNRILPKDGPAFRCWARLMHRRSDTLYEDAMIAAIATVHQLTVVTRNTRDFQGYGVALLNPWRGCCDEVWPPQLSGQGPETPAASD